VRIPSIARLPSIVLVVAAVLATLGCTRASSPTTRTRSLKPTLSTHPLASSKSPEDESPVSAFLAVESWARRSFRVFASSSHIRPQCNRLSEIDVRIEWSRRVQLDL
jgi:hypothetical protein